MLSFHVTLAHHPRPSVSPRNPCSLRVSALDSSSFPSFAVIRHSPLTPLFLPFVFNRFRTLSFSFPVSSLLATLTITAGVYPNNSHSGTHHPGVTTTIFVLSFHALTNCPFSISFLLIFIHVMGGVEGYRSSSLSKLAAVPTCLRAIPFFFRLLRTLLHSQKTQPFCFQAIPHSLPKTLGVGARSAGQKQPTPNARAEVSSTNHRTRITRHSTSPHHLASLHPYPITSILFP